MTYTDNYHLPQWVDEDRIQRVDFNGAMASIESGITAAAIDASAARTAANNAQSTADKAKTAASNAQSTANSAQTTAKNAKTAASNAQAAADAAQTAADAAQTAADAAQETADTAYSYAIKRPYYVGMYSGTGADLTRNIGFKPALLIIIGSEGATSLSSLQNFLQYSAIFIANNLGENIEFTSTGFTVKKPTTYAYPNLTALHHNYEFVAFK